MNYRGILYSQMHLDARKMKISFEERYFSLNRLTLLAIGLWPYQQSTFSHFRMVLLLGVMVTFIAFQFSRILLVERSFEFIIKMLAISSLFTFFILKYISCWINMETIRLILEWLQQIYNGLKDKNEIAIYDEYGNNARRSTIMIMTELSTLFIGLIMEGWPFVFDIVIPKNVSYARHLIMSLSNYYVMDEKYFYFIIIHLNASYAVGSLVLIAVGTILLSYAKHICGMFRIASYRIEQAMATNTFKSISLKNEFVIRKKIIRAVDIHRKAMEFAIFMQTNFEGSFLLIVGTTVICVSFNLYRICRIESPIEEIEETMSHLYIMGFVLVYMFVANYTGQEVTDDNSHIFLTIYNVPWYLAPLRIQKLILFLIHRGSKTFVLTASGLFIASLECFATLTSASISYFTVIYSVQ